MASKYTALGPTIVERLRAHLPFIETVLSISEWHGLKFVMDGQRAAVIIGINKQTNEVRVLAELVPANQIRLRDLKGVVTEDGPAVTPPVYSVDAKELGDLASVMTSAENYMHGAAQMLSGMADRFEAANQLVDDQNEALDAIQADAQQMIAKIRQEKEDALIAAEQQMAKLRAEKAELQSKLEETQRSKKKLREALERAKEAR